MREFWEWLDLTNDEVESGSTAAFFEPESVFWSVVRGLDIPVQSTRMTPVAKQKRLDKIRAHARQLQNLLKGTRFDVDLAGLAERVDLPRNDLTGLSDYPLCILTEQLDAVIHWAGLEDGHDQRQSETWMLRQGGMTARKTFLIAKLVHDFEHMLRELPPLELFSSLVNTALDLDNDAVNADSMQKFIQRIKERETDRAEPPEPGEFPHGSMLDLVSARTATLGDAAIRRALKLHEQAKNAGPADQHSRQKSRK